MKQLKFVEQKTEKKTWEFYPKHIIHVFKPWHKHIQMFHNVLYKTVGAIALNGIWQLHDPKYIYIDIDKILIALKAKNAAKVINVKLRIIWLNNLRIISKLHAYLLTMTKTPVKFRKNRYNIVRGVAHTRHPLSIYFVVDNVWKMGKFKLRKKWHKIIWGLTKTPITFQKN